MIETAEKFQVMDEDTAEWALEKIMDHRQVIESAKEQCEKMKARHEEWRDRTIKEHESAITYLQGLIRPWAEERLAGSKKKSLSLPSGTVGFKTAGEKWEFGGKKADKDNPELIAFAKKSMKEYFDEKVVETVKWAEMKKHLKVMENGTVCTEDGEIIDGMTYTEGTPQFYAKGTNE